MIYRTYLPDEIVLPCGARLKPVIGGHLEQKPFLTFDHSGVDVKQNGWAGPYFEREIDRMIVREAKRRKLKCRMATVLSRNLKGKNDLHGRPYRGTQWVFVEVKE